MMMHFNLMRGPKNASINFKVTELFKLELRKNWDVNVYPQTARFKRDPHDEKKLIPFSSETDFITTILRKEFGKSQFKFNFDMEVNNPDFPEEA